MATVKRTTVPEILAAIRDKLVSKGAVENVAQVKVCVRRESVPHLAAKMDVVLRPGRFLSVEGTNEGGSRWDTRVRRAIGIQVRSTFLAGGGGDDWEWVANHYPIEDAVLDALQDFDPSDDDDNVLLIEPARLTNGEGAEREAPNPAWGDSVFSLEILYHPNITASDEA